MWVRLNSGPNTGKAYDISKFHELWIGTNGTTWALNAIREADTPVQVSLTGAYSTEAEAVNAMYRIMAGQEPEVP